MHMSSARPGFTLLELLIVMLIIGLIAGIGIPNFQRAQPRYERQEFVAQLNAVTLFAWQRAITSHAVTKVVFNMNDRKAWIEVDSGERDSQGQPRFKKIMGPGQTQMTWADTLQIKQFIIEGFDEMRRFTGRKTEELWFFIVPGGLTQEVTINLVDTKDKKNRKPRPIGLVLNPFSAQFKMYEGFQK